VLQRGLPAVQVPGGTGHELRKGRSGGSASSGWHAWAAAGSTRPVQVAFMLLMLPDTTLTAGMCGLISLPSSSTCNHDSNA
jgi:hypothetical protein